MKIPIIFVILVVTYCMAADDSRKKSTSKETSENRNSENRGEESGPPPSGPPPSAGSPPPDGSSPPPRPRRSPPRFDANQMKSKYAKSSKLMGLVPFLAAETTNRQERSIADYLSPTSTLLYAAQPPVGQKALETTSSA